MDPYSVQTGTSDGMSSLCSNFFKEHWTSWDLQVGVRFWRSKRLEGGSGLKGLGGKSSVRFEKGRLELFESDSVTLEA